MKKIFLAMVLLLSFSTSVNASSVNIGKSLVANLLENKKVTLMIYGVATNDPLLSLIYKNKNDWLKLSKDKQTSVATYIKSLVLDAKSNPQKYVKMPNTASFYQKALANTRNMCTDCWEITHETEESYVMGDEAWNRREYKGKKNLSFSKFIGE